ncbi:Eco57I restriction-modification methylase domain-containing protein [Leisingera sp. ANG-Vp]|uniref:Eco57I restriction-modification methylase domain-containing protein n=1 Tax=Leisingera sp. ANG-Vp TaxID=1577896 RepID=UPI00057DFAC9|nr:N-6 DNA methylase [Leisingera sp. ANG-Vp]KIC22487.1 hypothetical protein RA20_00990 [Leisingera sp. ANG-Vp]
MDLSANLETLRSEVLDGGLPAPGRLAAALGWEAQDLGAKNVAQGGIELQTVRGKIGFQSAALFASPVKTPEIQPHSEARRLAAFYGYHASTRWGLFADDNGVTPFNSHWMSQDDWYLLPTIGWNEIVDRQKELSVFQPKRLLHGEADKAALKEFTAPTRLLQPVDDELVERLDGWRETALRESSSSANVDAQLQTLFAKLFVLRTIEDKGLAPEVQPLIRAFGEGRQLEQSELIKSFEGARNYVGSELFDRIELDAIPAHVISGVIYDLYYPSRIGAYNHRYNFSWIDSDVLGLAYEKYLSTILSPKAPSRQLDLFQGETTDVERISVRKAGGVYYTPQYLTRYLASSSIDEFYKTNDATKFPKIIDFACGSGSFLVSALDILLPRLKALDSTRNWAHELIEGGCISGVDVDEKAVTVARLNIWNRLAEEPDPLPLPNLSKVIVQGDGLDVESWSGLSDSFDICLGNPPFLATSRVADREGLEHKFSSAKGRYDFSYLFLEQATQVTAPDGILGMVMPNRLFRNKNAGPIRALLTDRMDIKELIDFGSNEVFEGTSAYVGCVVAAHRALLAPEVEHLDVVEVKELPERYISELLLSEDTEERYLKRYSASHPRGPGPWMLLSYEEKLEQIRISEASLPLSELSAVVQGIRTGANDVFILEIEDEGDEFVGVRNGLGDSFVLERGLLEPVVFGSEISRYADLQYNKYLLYPYKSGVCLSETELEESFPQTLKYLKSYRTILANRTSIKSSGLRWYELVRRRDETWLRAPKLLIRDLARETSFSVDEAGELFMVGGTAVVPESDDMLIALLGYLNSGPISKLVKRTTPEFRGGFQKFEPQHLQKIPVLRRLLEDEEFMEDLIVLTNRVIASSANASMRDAANSELDAFVSTALAAAGIEAGA